MADHIKTYRFNIPTRIATVLVGILLIATPIMAIKVNFVDMTYGEISLFEKTFLITYLIVSLIFGSGCFLAPFTYSLTISKDGYRYETTTFVLSSLWTDARIDNQAAIIFGRSGLLLTSFFDVELKKLAPLLGGKQKNMGGGVLINCFGALTSRELKRNIRDHAPYLFGFLYTEEDFLKTIKMLDRLIDRFHKEEVPARVFYGQYGMYYYRYIDQGEYTVNEFHGCLARHSSRVALHISVWREVIQRPRDEEGRDIVEIAREDCALISEIKARYA